MKTELKNSIKTFYAKTVKEWRKWLEKNCEKEEKVWLIIYKRETGVPSVYYSEAVDEALCFGWIDSKPNKRDDERFVVILSYEKNAILADNIGIGTIRNDDHNRASPLVDVPLVQNRNYTRKVNVFPNPAASVVNVQLSGYRGKVTLQLTDLRGKPLRQLKTETIGKSGLQQIEVSGLASGSYLLLVIDEKGVIETRKIVVTR